MNPAEKRRSQRLVKVVSIRVGLAQPKQDGYTRVINRHGALIVAPEDWAPGTRFAMQNSDSGEIAVCRVVWNGGVIQACQWQLGVEIVQDLPGFWGAAYAVDEAEEEVPR